MERIAVRAVGIRIMSVRTSMRISVVAVRYERRKEFTPSNEVRLTLGWFYNGGESLNTKRSCGGCGRKRSIRHKKFRLDYEDLQKLMGKIHIRGEFQTSIQKRNQK